MEKKKNTKEKFGAVSVLMITGLLASPCGIVGANSEFNTPITACDPTIDFIHVPEYPNPGNEDLEGNVTGIAPDDCRVAVYIRVGDVWWIKPYYASPLTAINPDGTWTCDITTGGDDRYATAVAAYLLPAGIEPPICRPCCELPVISGAVARAQQELLEPRTIPFAGYDWTVKRRDFCDGPGPNYFSDNEEDIWVDEGGLHLTISEHDGRWYCTEVVLNTSLGYGTYAFQTHGRVDITDPLMVLGLFTWDGVAEEQNYREIDIEFARWGNAGERTNAQYVVQPCSQCPGCDDLCTRFRVNLTDEDSDLTHYLVWGPGTVEFSTYYGRYAGSVPPASTLVHKWTHASKYVPEPGNENVRFNFWLHEGNAPASSQGDEVLITNFTWQEKAPVLPGHIATNLINYPIAGYFEGAEEIRIDDVPVTMDYYGGFRRDVVLNNGINSFKIDAIRGGEIYESVSMEINYDPERSTEDRTLLYSYGDPAKTETIVLDLDGGYILGVLSGVNIVAATHDGRHVVDTKGNVYQTSDHRVVGERLPFSQTTSYPVFSNDDCLCYAGNEKIRFADRTLVSDQFPVMVDGRFARLLPGNLLIQGSSDCFRKINLINDEVVDEIEFSETRVLWGTSAVAPCGDFGFVTSYSYAHGALDIIEMETGNKTSEFDYLSDYMGQISFSNDRSKAFVGSYGNSYYGKGGIYVIDLDTQTKLSYYKQFGASSVEVGPDGFVYISSRYVVHNGAKGSKDRRGIDVLMLNENNELHFIKTYYLNYEHCYSTKPTFFIKPVSAPTELPDMKITDVWTDNSTIYYKIKNVGGNKAGISETSLTVDGVFIASDSVASLDSGVERTESFNCTWDCRNLSYMIEVCADYMDDVEEYSHSNNCLTETWICPDLRITDVWFVNNSIIYYKMKNVGGITAGASNTSLIADGVMSEASDSVASLEPGVERTESFNHTWICTNPNDTITICADCTGDVAESNETNNCRTETLVCPPDIWVSPTSFDVRLGSDVVSNYTLTIGNNWIGVLEFNVSEVEDYHVTSQIGWPQETGGYVHSSPALGDIDGDGDLEVVVGSNDNKVYAWDCSGIYNPNNIEWGTFHHDVRRTGLYEAKLPKKGGWLSESPTNGTVYKDDQTTINVTFSTTSLPSGEYSANITITSNDPDENQVVIPVRLIVTPSQKGDLNHDGEITPADAVIALRIAVNDGYASEADVDENRCVNVLDALMIRQAAAGAISL
ncbi:MAG: CARDB domain-containing protein [Euryarchaeota archaeon]|nr:CARDB domain-containing protein [Euryarchaeota archaeon]